MYNEGIALRWILALGTIPDLITTQHIPFPEKHDVTSPVPSNDTSDSDHWLRLPCPYYRYNVAIESHLLASSGI